MCINTNEFIPLLEICGVLNKTFRKKGNIFIFHRLCHFVCFFVILYFQLLGFKEIVNRFLEYSLGSLESYIKTLYLL